MFHRALAGFIALFFFVSPAMASSPLGMPKNELFKFFADTMMLPLTEETEMDNGNTMWNGEGFNGRSMVTVQQDGVVIGAMLAVAPGDNEEANSVALARCVGMYLLAFPGEGDKALDWITAALNAGSATKVQNGRSLDMNVLTEMGVIMMTLTGE